MNFTDFSLVFRPDMSTTLTSIPQNDIHLNNLQPSKLITMDNTEK